MLRIVVTLLTLAAIPAFGGVTVVSTGDPCSTGAGLSNDTPTGAFGIGLSVVRLSANAIYDSTPSQHSSCTVTDVEDLIAPGPSGTPAFLQFYLLGQSGGGLEFPGFFSSSNFFSFNGVNEGSCGGQCSAANLTIPMTLGTPFELVVSSSVIGGPNNLEIPPATRAEISATVDVYTTCADCLDGIQNWTIEESPEPGTTWLMLAGAVACMFGRYTVRSRKSGS